MDQQRNRYNEQGPIPFRCGRFYSIDSQWWFSIRRGPEQGPFTTKSVAKQALIKFLNERFEFEKTVSSNGAFLRV